MKFGRSLDLFINVAFPLAIGVFIYWGGGRFSIPAMIRNYLPDGLWAYSLMSAMLLVWQRRIMIGWILAVFAFSIGFEILQSYHWIEGTGDLYDVLTYFLFFGFALVINPKLKNEKPNKTSPVHWHPRPLRPLRRLVKG
jgi:hypothetical protein